MTTFELKPEHVKLPRHAYVEWCDLETGAPAIDPKRPYGNSYVAGDVWEIIHGQRLDDEDELDRETDDAMLALHQETQTALQVVLATGGFEPGVYQKPRWGSDYGWRRTGDLADPTGTPPVGPATETGADPADWTAGPDGRANSGHLFETLTDEVERIIRGSAHDLIAGQAGAVARTILARLAHEHGLRPGT